MRQMTYEEVDVYQEEHPNYEPPAFVVGKGAF